jgi:uncharacterized protein (TIGR02001 family)
MHLPNHKHLKTAVLAAAGLGSLLVASQVMAGASANIGVTSNYISRGVEQTQGDPALQAGLDYEADNGLYVGTWGSNVKAGGQKGIELDLAGGWKKALANGVSVDVGASRYFYGNQVMPQFAEAYVKGGYHGVAAEVWYTTGAGTNPDQTSPKNGDIYYSLGYEGELKHDWKYHARVGLEKWKDPTVTDIVDTEVGITKTLPKAGDVALTLTKTDKQDAPDDPGINDVKASVSWVKTFDF